MFGSSALHRSFSALQRAEIAEIPGAAGDGGRTGARFSALQRAEIAEIGYNLFEIVAHIHRFSALQRAEIAEICDEPKRHNAA